jgi:hypothetical protein
VHSLQDAPQYREGLIANHAVVGKFGIDGHVQYT